MRFIPPRIVDEDMTISHHADCLIVGAELAGLVAARSLQSRGLTYSSAAGSRCGSKAGDSKLRERAIRLWRPVLHRSQSSISRLSGGVDGGGCRGTLVGRFFVPTAGSKTLAKSTTGEWAGCEPSPHTLLAIWTCVLRSKSRPSASKKLLERDRHDTAMCLLGKASFSLLHFRSR